MESIVCNSKEESIMMLSVAKEFFQEHISMDVDPSVIALHLSLIDAVEVFIKNNI